MLRRVFFYTLISLSVVSAQFGPTRFSDPIPTEVSVMYKRGISYLMESQNASGAWHDSSGRQPGVVAFCLLSVLAHGENLSLPRPKTFMERCLNYLLSAQHPSSGYIGSSMYNHGFSTLALAECYGHCGDSERIGVALQQAVNLILKAQEFNPKKGWRYNPQSLEADTTVTGCQLVALFAAQNAGISIPQEALSKGLAYLETCRTKEGSYGYTDSYNGKPTLTAIALLCHYLAKKEPTSKTKQSQDYLEKHLNYRDQHYPFYFEYYMSQALFQASPERWEDWNRKNIRYLKLIQASDGSWDGTQGKAYSTSAALLSLALNYRFMPIYERF